MNDCKQNLLNVARSLRETQFTAAFTMRYWGYGFNLGAHPVSGEKHTCGTPACAMGNYAVRQDLHNGLFSLHRSGELLVDGETVNVVNIEKAHAHFCLSDMQWEELFGGRGCGGAKRPEEAAQYIEDFAAKKWPEPIIVDPLVEQAEQYAQEAKSFDEAKVEFNDVIVELDRVAV